MAKPPRRAEEIRASTAAALIIVFQIGCVGSVLAPLTGKAWVVWVAFGFVLGLMGIWLAKGLKQ